MVLISASRKQSYANVQYRQSASCLTQYHQSFNIIGTLVDNKIVANCNSTGIFR